jgi:hypothetical protein
VWEEEASKQYKVKTSVYQEHHPTATHSKAYQEAPALAKLTRCHFAEASRIEGSLTVLASSDEWQHT